MKRRTFLTASSTLGIAGTVSGASVVSSVYSSISTDILLEEFKPDTRKVLDKFMADVALNVQELGLDKKIAKRIFTPVQIINKKMVGSNQNITFKNKSGEYISLSGAKNNKRISIQKSL